MIVILGDGWIIWQVQQHKTSHTQTQITTTEVAPSNGFVQFESKDLIFPRIGYPLQIKFAFANRGTRPVTDVQSWGMILLVDPVKNPPLRMKELFSDSFRNGYQKFTGEGSTLGIGISNWNVATSTTIFPESDTAPATQSLVLTQDLIDQLKDSKLRVYFGAGGGWKDEAHHQSYWNECEWADWNAYPDFSQIIWHNC